MGIHFEADAVRHKEMKDYFTVMIPLTYQKVLSLSQDWYNIRALSYILTGIRKKHFFFNSAKKNWDAEILLAFYFLYIITNPHAEHIWQDAAPDYSRWCLLAGVSM